MESTGSALPATWVYIAGPLFTQGEWIWNSLLRNELESRGLSVILPQEECAALEASAEGCSPQAIFDLNVSNLDRSDVVVAILDQADPDSGTSWECGYAYRVGLPVIGVRTDFRSAGDIVGTTVNLMLAFGCQEIVQASYENRENVSWIADRVVEAIARAISQKQRRISRNCSN